MERTNGSTILLVDDDPGVRGLVLEALQLHGYKVVPARDGVEAYELAGQLEQHIDLLLTDVVMPHMDGCKLARLLHEARPDLKVLYMSGFSDIPIVRQQVLDPGQAFIPKPFTLDRLLQHVDEVLDGR